MQALNLISAAKICCVICHGSSDEQYLNFS